MNPAPLLACSNERGAVALWILPDESTLEVCLSNAPGVGWFGTITQSNTTLGKTLYHGYFIDRTYGARRLVDELFDGMRRGRIHDVCRWA